MLGCLVVADGGAEPGGVREWISAVTRFENEGHRGGPRGFVVEDRVLVFVVAFLGVLVLLFPECFGVRWICWTRLRVLFVWIFAILYGRDCQHAEQFGVAGDD